MLDEGSSHLKRENKLLKLEQTQDRKVFLDGDSTDEVGGKKRRLRPLAPQEPRESMEEI